MEREGQQWRTTSTIQHSKSFQEVPIVKVNDKLDDASPSSDNSPSTDNFNKNYRGPCALLEPNDPFGMRWTMNNGEVMKDSVNNHMQDEAQQTLDSPNSKDSSPRTLPSPTKSFNNNNEMAKENMLVNDNQDIYAKPARFFRTLSFKKQLNRLVEKNGECNVTMKNVPSQKWKYFNDIFTTVVEMKWRWCILSFALSFFLGWLFFAVIYFTIMFVHGDLNHMDDAHWTPCVQNTRSFMGIFMFSLETQHTIGYGSRFPTEQCPPIVVAICFQSIIGIMIQTLLTGVVFAKLARPKKRAATLIFSKNCCICMRDGKLCLLFRVGDMRKSHLAEAHIRLQMISKRITNEGELLPFHQFDMNVGYDAGLDRIFIVWPITICHVIDDNSPLYSYSADDLSTARFEIIAILEGVVPSTGSTTQARTSFLPNEVLWGHRFEKLVTYQRDNGEYTIDFSKFHNTFEIDTPTLSAKEMNELTEAGLNFQEVYQCDNEEPPESPNETASSEFIFVNANHRQKPSIVEEFASAKRDMSSTDETQMLIFPSEPGRYSLTEGLSAGEFPFRQGRKMSTLSDRLDRVVPTIINNVMSNKSLATIRSAGSALSLVGGKEKVITSVLREHDMF